MLQVFRKMTDEEKKALQVFEIDGMPRNVDEIKSRRKKKGDFQYEVSWKGLPSIRYNKWFTREVSCCFSSVIVDPKPRNRHVWGRLVIGHFVVVNLELPRVACQAHDDVMHAQDASGSCIGGMVALHATCLVSTSCHA